MPDKKKIEFATYTLNQSVSRRPGGHRQAEEEHQTGKGCNVQVAFQLPSAVLQVLPNQKGHYI